MARKYTKLTNEQKRKISQANAARWQVEHPDGRKEIVFNLTSFARRMGLRQANLWYTSVRPWSHKGYKATKLGG